jgi:hypothetical protein
MPLVGDGVKSKLESPKFEMGPRVSPVSIVSNNPVSPEVFVFVPRDSPFGVVPKFDCTRVVISVDFPVNDVLRYTNEHFERPRAS